MPQDISVTVSVNRRDFVLAVVTTTADYLARWNVYPSDEADAWITQAVKTVNYYERTMAQLGEDLYNGDKTVDEFEVAIALLIALQLRRAWNEGMREAELSPSEMTLDMENELQTAIASETEHVRKLADDIKAAALAGVALSTLLHRFELWSNRYNDIRNRGMIAAGIELENRADLSPFEKKRVRKFEWVLGATEEHCKDCAGYAGKIMTAREWHIIYRERGHRPQSYELACKGFNCDCSLRRVKS